MPLTAPGEIARPPIHLREGTVHTARTGEPLACFDQDHTIADVIRYAIAMSDYEEVRALVEMMSPDA